MMTRIAQDLGIPFLLAALVLGTSPVLAGAAAPDAGGASPQSTIEGAQEAAPPPIDMTKDWPCVQRKVETLSVGAIWDGPSIEGLKGWYRDGDLVAVVDLVSSRRVTEAEADAAVKKYAEALPEAERDAKLTMLFAAVFDKFSSQRRQVMTGIEKYQKSQKERARELERQSSSIAELENKLPPATTEEDPPELADAREKFNWAQRIFQERQSNVPLACELPVLIEERLYAVAQSIRGLMKS